MIFTWWAKKKNTNESSALDKVNERVISDVYNSIKPEIDSLQKFDKGEKDINAPDIKTAVRGLQ